MEMHGAGIDAAEYIPDILMCVAVKSGLALQKVMAAQFLGADDGSW